jgi:hypothetical protein
LKGEGINMAKKTGYLIHRTQNKYVLCKVLNEYESEQDAENGLIDLLVHDKTEKQILKEFEKKR